ncbi:UDP-glucose/GDP-mannose dehydrogenase family protein [Pseudoduganella ginsengisoli]
MSGACFADVGNNVLCLDVDERKINMLNNGEIPIHEPGLEGMVVRNAEAGRLKFSTSYDVAVEHAEVIFLAVGTPPDEDGSADLQYILAAARSIGQRITKPVVVVDKSTVPVGTADKVRAAIGEEVAKRGVNVSFSVVSNPEFLKEGAALDDFMKPDRIVVGGDDAGALKLMRQLYAPFSRNHEKFVAMDVRSAELTKYAANAMLATRISFMNELANLAELLGADIESVRLGIGMDPRIGSQFLYPGMGYGGSCFPKDVKALVKTAADNDQTLHILTATELVNENQKNVLFNKLVRFYGGVENLRGKTIGLWGLSFKPNTDDMREAPSLVLIRNLFAAGASVRAYDPVASKEALRVLTLEHGAEKLQASLEIVGKAGDAVQGADVLVLVTEWKEFRTPDFNDLAQVLRDKAVFDGRNIYDPEVVATAGLRYEGIGRIGKAGA